MKKGLECYVAGKDATESVFLIFFTIIYSGWPNINGAYLLACCFFGLSQIFGPGAGYSRDTVPLRDKILEGLVLGFIFAILAKHILILHHFGLSDIKVLVSSVWLGKAWLYYIFSSFLVHVMLCYPVYIS